MRGEIFIGMAPVGRGFLGCPGLIGLFFIVFIYNVGYITFLARTFCESADYPLFSNHGLLNQLLVLEMLDQNNIRNNES